MRHFASNSRLKRLFFIPLLKSQRFIGAWMRSPFSMGAVVPSSRALARAMAAQVDPAVPGAIVELGAGTGVMTQALLETGIDAGRFIILERNDRLHHLLMQHFPQLNVICADAARLNEILGAMPVSAIVSSLPLLSMPRARQAEIERRMVEAVGEHGRIIQFTYGPKSPISDATLRQYPIEGRRVKTVLANVPPAHVWVYRRRPSH